VRTEDELSKQLLIHPVLGHYYLLWGRRWTRWEGRDRATACANLSFPSLGQMYHFLVSWQGLHHSKGTIQANRAADVIVYSTDSGLISSKIATVEHSHICTVQQCTVEVIKSHRGTREGRDG